MNVALLLAPQWNAEWPSAAFALFSAELKLRNHEVKVFDLNLEMLVLCRGREEFRQFPTENTAWADRGFIESRVLPAYGHYLDSYLKNLLAFEPRVVGFCAYFSNLPVSLYLARKIKELSPSTITVFGGPACDELGDCRALARSPAVDAVVWGEADKVFPDLVDAIARGGKLQPAPGIILGTDPPSREPQRPAPLEMDELPIADFESFPLLTLYKGKTVNSSRGCVRRCNYCSDWRGKKYRQMSGARVHREISAQLQRTPAISRFFFADSLINGSMAQLEEFYERAIADALAIDWHAYAIIRPEMTPRVLSRMRRAGCESLLYGVESGSERVLQAMNKHVRPELNGRVLRASAQAGVKTVVTLIVGYHAETEEDFEETLDFITRHKDSIGLLTPSLFSTDDMLRGGTLPAGVSADHPMFWRTPDGSNTYPMRLNRLKRLFERAAECGVSAAFEGRIAPAEMLAGLDGLLGHYERWRAERPAALTA